MEVETYHLTRVVSPTRDMDAYMATIFGGEE